MKTTQNKPPHSEKQADKATSQISKKEKFMPNLNQLKEAAEQLPNPEIYVSDNYSSRIAVGSKFREIDFTKQKIQRGSRVVGRWIYEGKLLIRNRDNKEKDS